jgi:hypothetical protein
LLTAMQLLIGQIRPLQAQLLDGGGRLHQAPRL